MDWAALQAFFETWQLDPFFVPWLDNNKVFFAFIIGAPAALIQYYRRHKRLVKEALEAEKDAPKQ